MQWASIVYSIVYYILYPVFLIIKGILYVLHWLVTPIIYLGYFIRQIALIPWRFVAEFEAIWYFLGCAIVLGIVSGLILHLILRIFSLILDVDRKPVPKDIPAKGHDAVSYRAAREAKKQKELDKQLRLAAEARLIASQPLIQEVVREARQNVTTGKSSTPLSPNLAMGNRVGLLQETILEHTDEDDDNSVF